MLRVLKLKLIYCYLKKCRKKVQLYIKISRKMIFKKKDVLETSCDFYQAFFIEHTRSLTGSKLKVNKWQNLHVQLWDHIYDILRTL